MTIHKPRNSKINFRNAPVRYEKYITWCLPHCSHVAHGTYLKSTASINNEYKCLWRCSDPNPGSVIPETSTTNERKNRYEMNEKNGGVGWGEGNTGYLLWMRPYWRGMRALAVEWDFDPWRWGLEWKRCLEGLEAERVRGKTMAGGGGIGEAGSCWVNVDDPEEENEEEEGPGSGD